MIKIYKIKFYTHKFFTHEIWLAKFSPTKFSLARFLHPKYVQNWECLDSFLMVDYNQTQFTLPKIEQHVKDTDAGKQLS